MSAVDVCFLGTGDAFGSGGRLPTSSLVRSGAGGLLVDCGASALASLRRQGDGPDGVDAIAITHLHGDHFAGVPFFLMDAHYATRRAKPLVIAGPAGVAAAVWRLAEALFPGAGALPFRFPLTYLEWTERRALTVGPAEVTPFAVRHAPALECFGLRVSIGGRVVAFSGDTEWTDALVPLAEEADLFVCECFGDDKAPPHHLDFRTLQRHRHELTCRRLVLTHMGEDMLKRAPIAGYDMASDGLILSL